MKTQACYITTLILAFSLLFIGKIVAQQPSSFTLQQAIEYGLEHNEQIKNKRLDQEASESTVLEVFSQGLPQISASSQFQNSVIIPRMIVPANAFDTQADPNETSALEFGTSYSFDAGIQLNQLVFDGSYIVGLSIAKKYKEIAVNQTELTKRDIVNQIIDAYSAVLIARKNLEVIDSIQIIVESIYKDTEALVSEGLIERIELDKAKLAQIDLQTQRKLANQQYANSKMLLKMTISYDINEGIQVADELDTQMGKILNGSINYEMLDVRENLEYRMLTQKLDLDELNVERHKMSILPTVSAFYNLNSNAGLNEFNSFPNNEWFPSSGWGIRVNVPIVSSGNRYAKKKKAQIQALQTTNSLKELERKLKVEEFNLRNELENSKAQYQLMFENLKLSKKVLINVLEKRKQGLATSLELSQAQNQYMAAEIGLLKAAHSLISTQNNLDKLNNNFLIK